MSNSYRTYSYTYGNSDFGDQLTAYDGVTITYDALGNPLSYYNGTNYTFTWTGRELATATKGSGSVISYEYNASGMRTSKTVGGAKTLYFYDGDRLVGEMNGTNITVYLYSPDGGIAGMQVRSLSSSSSGWSIYWYEKNLQGDIVAIYGENGTKYVNYCYDAWGNHVVNYTNGGGSITAIANNPFRYRSYYYDTDLNLYYLGSRYYDSAIGRFINADAIGVITATPMALTDKNLYAYCDNNPVMRVDHGGDFWLDIVLDISSAIESICGVVEEPENALAWVALAVDVTLLFVPFVSGGGSVVRAFAKADDIYDITKKAYKTLDAVEDIGDTSKALRLSINRFTPNQNAVLQLAKEAHKTKGISLSEAETLWGWAQEYGLNGSRYHGPKYDSYLGGSNFT